MASFGETSEFAAILDSAARLQSLLPEAVLVGGSAAAFHAGHRLSFDHDHVLPDLQDRFDTVIEALDREGDWVTNRVTPGKIILGELGGIETGVGQLIRARPLEVEIHTLPSGAPLTVPTADETLRIKAFLIVKRNQVRDYLDVAALAERYGVARAGSVLARIDEYYSDREPHEGRVAAQVAAQLAAPKPADSRTLAHLERYKGLASRWHEWSRVVAVCRATARAMAGSAL
jgi:hypothetical protein